MHSIRRSRSPRQNHIFSHLCTLNLLLLVAALLLCLASRVDAFPCIDERCDCKFINSRKFASCAALNLSKLPQCFEANDSNLLQDVQAINLTQNYFPELTAEFFHKTCLDNLQLIYIQQASLSRIDNHAFYPLKNVIELSLSLNSIRNIPSKAVENLTNLRYLDLSFNNIDHIANDSLVRLANLRTLLLNNNKISFIDIDAFNGLLKIETIKLNINRLATLQPETFINLKVLHSLYLEGNYWNCDCKMQPFQRMLLLKYNKLKILDNPQCVTNKIVWSDLGLENFQCLPGILRNYSDSDVTISEGSTLRLKCAIFIESFGDSSLDEEYFSYTQINWHWKNVLISNNSKGCDHNCRTVGDNGSLQQFQIHEYIGEYDNRVKIKISNLVLFSVMTVNEGNYVCSAANKAGSDEQVYHVNVIPYYSSGSYSSGNKQLIASASSSSSSSSSDSQILSYNKNKMNINENGDHILFGLVLGILCGIFIVLVIFSAILVIFYRKNKVSHQPHELAMVDASTDNNTVDENNETNTETTEKLNVSQAEFNPLLMVNPVQKPPRLGIPDVSSIYSNPSWTMDRANYNRSRYASYAETEPLYSDYYTLYRANRQINSRLDNRTFISDTASEV